MQALINAAAVNLAQSGFRCKCIPAAITVSLSDKMTVDQTSAEAVNASTILFAVVDSDKEEFLFSELTNSSHVGIELDVLEKLMGLALSSGKAVHAHMLSL